MSDVVEKRKKVALTKDEINVVMWVLVKGLSPIIVIVAISSSILFFGLEFLMRKTSFTNYGLAPGLTTHYVTQFITTYIVIAASNVLLMVTLSVIVIYLGLQNIILPVIRITRELRKRIEDKSKVSITVRKNDKLLLPLVELINKLS